MTSITTSILYDNCPFSVFGEINYILKNTNLSPTKPCTSICIARSLDLIFDYILNKVNFSKTSLFFDL